MDPVHPAQIGRDPLGICVAVDQNLVGQQRALSDAGLFERDETLLGVAGAGDRVGIRAAELEVRGGDGKREDHRHAGARGDPAAPRDGRGPARPGATRLVVGAPVGPVEAWAELGQQHREQRDRHGGGDERDQHAAVAHRAQEWQRQRDQREEPDRHGEAAEYNRASGGLHRTLNRLVTAAAVGALLAPARGDE
jgi:hypothetical protein